MSGWGEWVGYMSGQCVWVGGKSAWGECVM